MQIQVQPFKALITTWYLAGFEAIDFYFIKPELEASQLDFLTKLVNSGNLADAEGYASVVLDKAVVPGVIQYTLTGK